MWDPIKIGSTERIDRNGGIPRVKEVTKISSEPFLLAAVHGTKRLEKQIQKIFWADRIRGEWFRQTSDLLFLISLMVKEASEVAIFKDEYVCLYFIKRTTD